MNSVSPNLVEGLNNYIEQITEQYQKLATVSSDLKATLDRVDLLEDKSTDLTYTLEDKDTSGVFKTVTFRRKLDGTLHSTSKLSDYVDGMYKKRTYTTYGNDGVTIRAKVEYTISYDAYGNVIGEV